MKSRALYYKKYHKQNRERRNFEARNRLHLKRCNQTDTDVTREAWECVLKTYTHRCAGCRQKSQYALVMDHVTPPNMGGRHVLKNLQPLCIVCNARKGQTVKRFELSTDLLVK